MLHTYRDNISQSNLFILVLFSVTAKCQIERVAEIIIKTSLDELVCSPVLVSAAVVR